MTGVENVYSKDLRSIRGKYRGKAKGCEVGFAVDDEGGISLVI